LNCLELSTRQRVQDRMILREIRGDDIYWVEARTINSTLLK
jgi:hypothetical protein